MRALITLIKINIQGIVKRAAWVAALAFGVLFSIGCYIYSYSKEPEIAISQMVYGQAILTLTFMLIGIEMVREQRQTHLDDMLPAVIRKNIIIPLSQMISVTILTALGTAIILAACLAGITLDNAPKLWLAQSAETLILLYFLPCLIMGIWGLLISFVDRRKSVYLPAVLVWGICSSLFTYVIELFPYGSLPGKSLLNMFNLGIINFRDFRNFMTGGETESPRWMARVVMLIIVIAVYLLVSSASYNGKKPLLIALTAAFCAGLLAICISRYNVFFSRFADSEDAREYTRRKGYEYLPGESVSLNDFPQEKNIEIMEERIDLSCGNAGICASVEMKVRQINAASEQSFTLYSELIIDSVMVDGEIAEYERSLDGILVHYPHVKKEESTTDIRFIYHGYSLPSFPANETTVQLNKSFPWLPWPGLKTSVKYDNNLYRTSEMYFTEPWQRSDSIEFELTYKGPGNLYCNLDDQGNNIYRGISDDGISLYSGMIGCEYRDVKAYIPSCKYRTLHDTVDSVLDAYDVLIDFCQKMDVEIIPEKPETIILVQMEAPVIYQSPQEIYCRGKEWEIRCGNECSSVVTFKSRYGSAESYRESEEVNVNMAVSMILSPSVGYPTECSPSTTKNFAELLGAYLKLPGCDDQKYRQSAENLKNRFGKSITEYVNGERITMDPLSASEQKQLQDVLAAMRNGENFDDAFRAIYHRIVNGENLSVSEMITELYDER